MTFENQLFILISIVGAVQSLFLAVYILSSRKNSDKVSLILSILLIVYALRVTKWVVHFLPEVYFQVYSNLMFGLQTIIAPLLYLYLNQFLDKNYDFRKIDILHFLPFLFIIFIDVNSPREVWQMTIFKLMPYLTFYWLIHLLFSAFHVYTYREYFNELEKNEKKWLIYLLVGNFAMCISFIFYAVLGWASQNVFSSVFTFVSLVLSFIYLKQMNGSVKKAKKNKSPIENIDLYMLKLKGLVEEKIYLDTNLTMPKMAEKMKIPNYLLSQIINEHYGQNFSDFINAYRIEEAKRLLSLPQNQEMKIASIAYDSGFNTLSAFNTAFKKMTNTTPSAYRNSVLPAN